jgi:tRNA(fMet)-specific endonuclease VapC
VEIAVLLDTNRLTDALRGDGGTVDLLEHANRIFIPFIALAEIKAGFLCGTKRDSNERALNRFLGLSGVVVIFADAETIGIYARLFGEIRSAGKMVPANDLWIASLAVQHHLVLATRDRHFRAVPQITTI